MKLNMFAMATNSRYQLDESKNNLDDFFKNLYTIENANANMTILRDNFEKSMTFDEYVKNMSESFTVSPAYYIISGVKKNEGVVIQKDAGDKVSVYTWLNESPNNSLLMPKNKDNTYFIVQTNFDRDTKDLEHNDERRYLAEKIINGFHRNLTLKG